MDVDIPVRAVLVSGERRPVETVTVNLSTTGALLERTPGLGRGPWQIQVFLPDSDDPVCCGAVLKRETDSHCGVEFDHVSDRDHHRLHTFVTLQQRTHTLVSV